MNITEEFKSKTNSIIQALRGTLRGIRTNRPSTALVEDLIVEYHEQRTPLKHLSSIGITPPREITIQVWEEDMVKEVTKAIEVSDLNLSSNVDGKNTVRIFLPELSQERREELVIYVKKKVEEYRIQVRKNREDFNRKVDRFFSEDEIGEDDKFRQKDEIQKITDQTNDKIEELFEEKKKTINQ